MKNCFLIAFVFLLLSCSKNHISLPDLREKGISTYRADQFQKGLNLYNFRYTNKIKLIDMQGTEIHSWHIQEAEKYHKSSPGLHYVKMDSSKNLFSIVQPHAIIKKSWDNQLIWEKRPYIYRIERYFFD